MSNEIEKRLARAEAILGNTCETCPHMRFANMPDEELEGIIAQEMYRRLEALPYEEAKARLAGRESP